ncbi:MAG: phosphoribosylformylglycinamidine synthase subunit PurS [Chloroflexia bacterium]|jgi:phosphoribosylformylglycinamidine synthase|nr:phosphoribosylformylglycinamidine synthase subunit PurS [Chloroflexia bacterium]MDQ3613242.1 phosphoribosylformylglycinamidine synthase subunit PurS [Chloroflexota bacterium]
MTIWRVEAMIMPKDGVNDPQGEAVHGGLKSLEFVGVQNVRVGKIISLSIEAKSEDEAIDQAMHMCDQLLANPVIETYSLTATQPSPAAKGSIA